MPTGKPLFEVSTEQMRGAGRGLAHTPRGTFVVQWDAEEGHLLLFTDPDADATLSVRPIAGNAVSLCVEREEE